MNGNLMGKRVECVSASDHCQVLDGGYVYAYSNKPVYMIRRDDGSKFTWNQDIVREAPPEPTVELPASLVTNLLNAVNDKADYRNVTHHARMIDEHLRQQS